MEEEEKKRFFNHLTFFFFAGLLNLSSGGVTFRASLAASCDFLPDLLGYHSPAQCRTLPELALKTPKNEPKGTGCRAWQSSR